MRTQQGESLQDTHTQEALRLLRVHNLPLSGIYPRRPVVTCGRLRLLRHNPNMVGQPWRLWLSDRLMSLEWKRGHLAGLIGKIPDAGLPGQVEHLDRVIEEVRKELFGA